MPLTSKWWLSKKKGKEAWVEPIVDRESKTIKFEIRVGQPESIQMKEINAGSSITNSQGKKAKAAFGCIICKVGTAKGDYIDAEANEGRMGAIPLAIDAAIERGVRVRILVPYNEAVEDRLKLNMEEELGRGQEEEFTRPIYNADIDVRYIE